MFLCPPHVSNIPIHIWNLEMGFQIHSTHLDIPLTIEKHCQNKESSQQTSAHSIPALNKEPILMSPVFKKTIHVY